MFLHAAKQISYRRTAVSKQRIASSIYKDKQITQAGQGFLQKKITKKQESFEK